MGNCLCNIFDDNNTLWLLIIGLVVLSCCCGRN